MTHSFFNLGTAGSALLGGTAGLQIFSAFTANQAIEQGLDLQEKAFQNQIKENRAATDLQTIQRFRQMRITLSANEASAAVRGISAASPTFKFIQEKNFSRFNEAEHVSQLNEKFRERRILEQQRINRLKANAQEDRNIFGAILGVAEIAATIILL